MPQNITKNGTREGVTPPEAPLRPWGVAPRTTRELGAPIREPEISEFDDEIHPNFHLRNTKNR